MSIERLPFTRRDTLMLAAALALFADPALAAAKAGIVESLTGEGFAEGPAPRRALGPAAEIFMRELVGTGSGSRLGLKLGAATTVRLGAETRFRVERHVVESGGTYTLEAGAILYDGPRRKGATVIRSPFGLISVRGTRFFAGPSNGVFGVFVARGEVRVTGGGSTVTVRTNEGSNIATPGGKPTPPTVWGATRVQAALASVL